MSRASSPGRPAFGSATPRSGGRTPRTSGGPAAGGATSARRSFMNSERPQSAGGGGRRASTLGIGRAENKLADKAADKEKADDKPDGRVRVAVRCRPMLKKESEAHGDQTPLVEMEPEVKRVLLKRDHWDCDSYTFDTCFPAATSQRRLFDEFCQPVVESVCKGYNGTVMAYGQTGTGKTHTLGNLGVEDSSQRGIVVRSFEQILGRADTDKENEYTISLSYLQLYMETVLDLLAPDKEGLNIVEDPQSGEVMVPGAKVVSIHTLEDVIKILKIGEQNRVVANQKLNAQSSRSHSVLVISVRVLPREDQANLDRLQAVTATKGKLLLVDLAGSERISKSGSEGQTLEEAKFINLSLTALGKCINVLSEGNPVHIPYRDSKLTRMLKDSFGGTARTSLIVTVSPLRTHLGETTSALAFGQRAIKIENTTKIREEVDLRVLNHRLQAEVDLMNNRFESQSDKVASLQAALSEETRKLMDAMAGAAALQAELNEERASSESRLAKVVADMEAKAAKMEEEVQQHIQTDRTKIEKLEKSLKDKEQASEKERSESSAALGAEKAKVAQLGEELREVRQRLAQKEAAVEKLSSSNQSELSQVMQQMEAEQATTGAELEKLKAQLAAEAERSAKLVAENATLAERAGPRPLPPRPGAEAPAGARGAGAATSSGALEADADVHPLEAITSGPELQASRPQASLNGGPTSGVAGMSAGGGGGAGAGAGGKGGGWNQHRDAVSAVSKLFEHVGLTTVFGLLKYEDRDVRLHAVKVIANLAAEEENQVNIVQEGGLEALFELLRTCKDEMTLRVAAGAVANLAMSEANQKEIVEGGGLDLLVQLSETAHDSQTQRMIAGAIANLCGNATIIDKLHASGSLKVLVKLSESQHMDVLSQVARGFANNSKCSKGKIHLVELGALPTIVMLAQKKSNPTVRKHAVLALCQIASHEANQSAIRESGALSILSDIASNEPASEFQPMAEQVVSNCNGAN